MLALGKRINAPHRTVSKASEQWSELRWLVQHAGSGALELGLNIGPGNSGEQKLSVSLFWDGVAVGRICVRYRHRGVDPALAHMHVYDDAAALDTAVPLSAFPQDDARAVLLSACATFGIEFAGTIEWPAADPQSRFFRE